MVFPSNRALKFHRETEMVVADLLWSLCFIRPCVTYPGTSLLNDAGPELCRHRGVEGLRSIHAARGALRQARTGSVCALMQEEKGLGGAA